MRRVASTGPPRLEVLRHFEPSRLAKNCQARAYELVPVEHRTKTKTKAGTTNREAVEMDRAGVEQGGVAA